MVENFPDGIVFLYEESAGPEEGGALRYTFVGGEGREIGLTKDDLEGQIVAENRPPDIKGRIRSQYRKALDGEAVTSSDCRVVASPDRTRAVSRLPADAAVVRVSSSSRAPSVTHW